MADFKLREPHFEATIQLLGTSEGGRRTAMRSGYRGAGDFGIAGTLNDIVCEFIEADWMEPGQSGKIRVWLAVPTFQVGRLSAGFTFGLYEGPRLVGEAVITRILDPHLQKSG